MAQNKSQLQTIASLGAEEARREQLWRSLATAIAKDILPLEEIINAHGLTLVEWERVKEHTVFRAMLIEQMQLWAAAENTPERIRLKYLSMIEQSAPDFFQAMVDTKESLADRTRVLQTIMKGAGIGQEAMDAAKQAAASGNRVTITINMGDTSAAFTKTLPPRVIDNNVNREATTIEYDPAPSDGEEYVRETLDAAE